MQNRDDHELVAQAQNGHTWAVGALYDRHHEAIFRFVWARVGSRAVAEDLTGDIFVRMVTSLPGYQAGDTPFRAWLYRIARNRIIDHLRQSAVQPDVALHESAHAHTEKEELMHAVDFQLSVESVRTALEQINPAERDVVTLRFLIGLSLQEVADTLDKSVGAVKTLQHRGLRSLRAALLPMEVDR